jgi:hypothetical protein
MSEFTEEDMCLDPCCAREVSDRRKALSLKKQLDAVDISTAKLKQMEIYGSMFCCPCQNKSCVNGDYALLLSLRSEEEKHSTENESFAEESNPSPKSGEDVNSDDELDDLLDEFENDEQMQALNSERMALIRRQQEQVEIAKAHGFGVHRPFPHDDNAAAQFIASLPRAVIHVCDENSRMCALVDLYLESKAPKYPGTAFLRISPGASSPLALFLNISSSSGLIAMASGNKVASTKDHSQFGNGDFIDRRQVDLWFDRAGVLESSPQPQEWTSMKWPVGKEVFDEEEYYACGHPGCKKTFRHDHVSTMLPAEYKIN